MRLIPTFCAAVLLAGAALPAAAQDRMFNFSLRGGVGAAPEYLGSDDLEAVPDIGFSFGALRLGGIDIGNGVRAVPDNGLSVIGAFRVIGSRDAEDSPELAGLDDIDTAVELGLGLKYQQTNWMAFGEVRKGVTGHSAVTGTLGADYILRPNDRWLITAGPRVSFGDDDFAQKPILACRSARPLPSRPMPRPVAHSVPGSRCRAHISSTTNGRSRVRSATRSCWAMPPIARSR